MNFRPPPKIKAAIIGAGISGLTCGRMLSNAGFEVYCFEKSRGPGGRMSTRRSGSVNFDHGAQFFKARSPEFIEAAKTWLALGVAKPWYGNFGKVDDSGTIEPCHQDETLWVGHPKMSSITRHLSHSLNVLYGQKIVSTKRKNRKWILESETGMVFNDFDILLLSCPGPQAATLVPHGSKVHGLAKKMQYDPCWALMMDFEQKLPIDWDALTFTNGPIRWAARNTSKRGRGSGERWVVHASSDWSMRHFNKAEEWVKTHLSNAFMPYARMYPQKIIAHRWRFAKARTYQGPSCGFDKEWGLGLCGDGFLSGRVESAWLSGHALGQAILEHV